MMRVQIFVVRISDLLKVIRFKEILSILCITKFRKMEALFFHCFNPLVLCIFTIGYTSVIRNFLKILRGKQMSERFETEEDVQ